MTKNQVTAKLILDQAKAYGWAVDVHKNVLSIVKLIPIGDKDAFCKADSEWYFILSLLPETSAGSTWGTDGSGVGAISAVEKGVFRMNKSGGSKRVLSALQKMI